MKNFKNTVLRTLSVLIVLGISYNLSLASGGLNIIPVSGDSKVIVSLDDISSEKIVLTIEDYSEEVIYYSEKIKNPSEFHKVFNLSALEDGDYTILVKTDSDVIKSRISISDSKITEKSEKEVVEPIFRITDDILYVFFTNKDSEYYSIRFMDKEGDFFSDSTTEESVAKRYDLSNLPVGEYMVLVSNEVNTFAYDISK